MKFKHIIKLIFFITISFIAGYLFHLNLISKKNIKRPETTLVKKVIKEKKEKSLTQKHQKLIRDYYFFKRNYDQNVSFKDFLIIRKNELIQNNMFSVEEENSYEEILSLESENDKKFDSYTVYGEIQLNSCDSNDEILIAVYFNKPEDFFSIIPENNILNEEPAFLKIINCKEKSFSLDIEIPDIPFYIVGYLYNTTYPASIIPKAIAIDDKTYGIQPSLLTLRKKNEPIKLVFKTYNEKTNNNLNIFTKNKKNTYLKDSVATFCGIEEISNKFLEKNLFRYATSDPKGVIRLKEIPNFSEICISIKDLTSIYTDSFFITNSNANSLVLDAFLSKDSGVLVINNNLFDTWLIFNESNKILVKNKSSIFLVEDLNNKTFLDLRYGIKSQGLISFFNKKNKTRIIQPKKRIIEKLKLNINKNNAKVIIDNTELEKTGKNIIFDNIVLFDNTLGLNLLLDQNFYIPIFLNRDYKNLSIDINVPTKIETWKQVLPTIKGNSYVYGKATDDTRVFLFDIINEEAYEANYLDINTDEKITSNLKNYYLFNNIKPSSYMLYFIKHNKIIKSQNIEIKPERIVLII